MAKAIVRYPARGQAPEIYAMRLNFSSLHYRGAISSQLYHTATTYTKV